jgi:hypothetical protein
MDCLDREFADGHAWICTDLVLEGNLRGTRPKRLLAIWPSNRDRWTFATLTVLLNKRSPLWWLEDFMGLSTGHDGKSSNTFHCRGGGMMKEAVFIVKLHRHEKGFIQHHCRSSSDLVVLPGLEAIR